MITSLNITAMNANNPMTPGVYTVEKSAFPPSIGMVPTAIPAFVGYTQNATLNGVSLHMQPFFISSLSEYNQLFGGAPETTWPILNVPKQSSGLPPARGTYDFKLAAAYYKIGAATAQPFLMYNSLRWFFQNGGGQCYIVSIGTYLSPQANTKGTVEDLPTALDKTDLMNGIDTLTNIPFPKPTMIVVPDAMALSEATDAYTVQQHMLAQCGSLQDRVALLDIYGGYQDPLGASPITPFRNNIGTNYLNYGIAYYPWLQTNVIGETEITYGNIDQTSTTPPAEKMSTLFPGQPAIPLLDTISTDNNTVNKYVLIPELPKIGSEAPPPYQTWKTAFNGSPSSIPADVLNQKVVVLNQMYSLLWDLGTTGGGKFPAEWTDKPTISSTQLMSTIGLSTNPQGPLAAGMLQLDPYISNFDGTGGKIKTSLNVNFKKWGITGTPGPNPYAGPPASTPNEQFDMANNMATSLFKAMNKAVNNIVSSAATLLGQFNSSLEQSSADYANMMKAVAAKANILPPCAAMAGVITTIDNGLGVWNAPANVNIDSVLNPMININDEDQETLNVDVLAGKSINAIRSFYGRGPAIVWGARTLDGNSNDWRYINVRRTLIMIEQSVKNAAEQLVFKPNDAITWKSCEGMIVSFLRTIWTNGGLQGATAKDAFTVQIGLGKTMTAQDILSGIMRVSVKVAVVHPAEFIIITYEQEMAKSG